MKKIFLSCLFFIFSFFAFAEDDFFCVSTNIDRLTFFVYMNEEGCKVQEYSDEKAAYIGSIYLENIAEARYFEATFDENEILKTFTLLAKPKIQYTPATVINYMVKEFKLHLKNYSYEDNLPVLSYSTPEDNEVSIILKKNGIMALCYSKN